MTNQEVAKSLKNIRDLYPWGEDSYKTLDYAIRAVVELPKRRKEAKRWRAKALVEQEPCSDAISRQAVIDAMYELCNTRETLEENPWRDNPHIDAIIDAINNLPPVNPQEEGEYLKSAIRISKNIPKEMGEKVFFDTQAKMEVQND